MTILVVMGVSGAGKTTVARILAARLDWPFIEGDDLHPEANRAKMAAGRPLTDADRYPWLERIADWIDGQVRAGDDGVVTCSALTRAYRDILRRPQVTFVYLSGSRELLVRRLADRHGHFMPAELLDSQLTTLQEPGRDERAITVDVDDVPSAIADAVIAALTPPSR